jgi:hypothetical protein
MKIVFLSLAAVLSATILATGCGKESPSPSYPSVAPAPAPDFGTTVPETHATQAIKCPEAPRQIDKDILIDAKGQIGALGALTGASLEGKVSAISKDFISKYPNADKLLMAQLMMSTVCETLKTTTSLSDAERLDRINSVNSQIMQLFTAPAPKPDARSRAKHTDFPEPYRAVWQHIQVSSERQPTLYVFDPECDVHVYISELIHGDDSARLNMQNFKHSLVAKKFQTFTHTFKPTDELFRLALDTTLIQNDSHGAQLRKDYEEGNFIAMLVLQVKYESCNASYYIEYA